MQVEDPTQPRLTEFGACLYNLMISRGIRTFAELSRYLESKGHHVSRQTIGTYATGKRSAPTTFAEKFTKALDLSREEQEVFSFAFTYGQKNAS